MRAALYLRGYASFQVWKCALERQRNDPPIYIYIYVYVYIHIETHACIETFTSVHNCNGKAYTDIALLRPSPLDGGHMHSCC
jgi:hypothetical protein